MLFHRLGRKTGLMLSIILHIVSNVALSLVQDYHIFTALRFASGVSNAGMVQTNFVMSKI